VKNVRVPPSDLPSLTRSVIACLASILELEAEDVPSPPSEHPDPWTVWRNWLSQRALNFVPVLEPQSFGCPGPWLALLRAEGHGGRIGVVAFGSPPGIAWNPLGVTESFDAVEAGYVIAPADVSLWAPAEVRTSCTSGVVQAIAIAADAEARMVLVDQAAARAGRGLEGDRYFAGRGTFSNRNARGLDLTLIEAEALHEFTLRGGPLAAQEARRNVVTRGVDLNALVGKRFVVGDVQCFGQRLCEPCAHLERLTEPGTLRALVHRGGLRADICTDGVLRVGDEVRPD
jgi:hypothetical protein